MKTILYSTTEHCQKEFDLPLDNTICIEQQTSLVNGLDCLGQIVFSGHIVPILESLITANQDFLDEDEIDDDDKEFIAEYDEGEDLIHVALPFTLACAAAKAMSTDGEWVSDRFSMSKESDHFLLEFHSIGDSQVRSYQLTGDEALKFQLLIGQYLDPQGLFEQLTLQAA